MEKAVPGSCCPLRAFILSVIVLLAAGCAVNLPAVRDFSQTTVAASGSFDDIAEDLPRSCLRRVEISFMPAPEDMITLVDERVEYSREYEDALSTCVGLENSLDGIIGVNNVLKSYAEALGKLASDDVVTFTQEINVLEASLGRININGGNPFDGPRADAVYSLAKFLFNAAASGYRQKKLRETIRVGHEPLVRITGGLNEVAGDYQAILRNEKQNILQVQRILIRDGEKPEEERVFRISDSEIDERLFKTKRMTEFVEAKFNAAEDYKTILIKITEAHRQLYMSTNELDSALLISEIRKYSAELIPLINNVRNAYSE